jgi:RNA polymerase sigma-70 factor, ECF subfamily
MRFFRRKSAVPESKRVDEAVVSEDDMVQRAKAQRPGAFEALYYAHVDQVHRKLAAMVGPDPELDDLVQQVFVRAWQHLSEFRGEARLGTWLHRIAVNVALSHLRQRQRTRARMSAHAAESSNDVPRDAEAALDTSQRVARLHGLLERLKPKKRVVFVLYELEGHTLDEIAGMTQSSINTVAGRLRAARLELRRAAARVAPLVTPSLRRTAP